MNPEKIQSAAAVRGKTLVCRLLPGTDLIEGIKLACRQHRIRQAIITTAIGTLLHADLVYVVADRQAPLGVKYVDPRRIQGPLELLAGQGMVGEDDEETLSVHLHGIVSGPDMRLFGGHLVENGNPVLATAEVTIQEVSGVEIRRRYDKKTGFVLFQFDAAGFTANG